MFCQKCFLEVSGRGRGRGRDALYCPSERFSKLNGSRSRRHVDSSAFFYRRAPFTANQEQYATLRLMANTAEPSKDCFFFLFPMPENDRHATNTQSLNFIELKETKKMMMRSSMGVAGLLLQPPPTPFIWDTEHIYIFQPVHLQLSVFLACRNVSSLQHLHRSQTACSTSGTAGAHNRLYVQGREGEWEGEGEGGGRL